MGVQVPRRVHAEVPQEGAVLANQAALGHRIPRACPAQGMQDRRRTFDARPRAYADIDPAEIFGGRGDWVSEGKSSIWIAQNVERKLRNFLGHKFWARGYFVSTVGRDEETIRAYIKNQEIADKQLDQLQLKLASS
jgi:REP-associated tyrosine transposase